MFSRRAAPGWLIAYLAVSALDLVGVFGHSAELGAVTKPLLMPLLLAFFVSSLDGLHHHLAKWVKWALVCSWVGDVLLMPDGDLFFVLGLLAFLGAQICYILGFRSSALGPLRSRPWLVLPYAGYVLLLLYLLLPDVGGLALPVTVYAVALVTMAILATGVSPTTGVGALLFVASDSLLALTEFTDRLPVAAESWIMPTYLVGQLLIVLGVLQHLGRSSRAGAVRDRVAG